MSKPAARFSALLFTLASSAGLAQSSDLVTVVGLKFLKETEQVVAVMCIGEDECFAWAHGHLFEARLRKLIDGEVTKKKFLVLFGHHAMGKQDHKGVIGRFSRRTDDVDGAEYQLVEQALDGKPTCFEWFDMDGYGPAEVPKSGALVRCFGFDRGGEPSGDADVLREPAQTLRAANEAYNKASP